MEDAKAKEAESSDEDEVGKIIEREQQEHARAEKEEAERKHMEAEAEKERKLREERDAKKIEEISNGPSFQGISINGLGRKEAYNKSRHCYHHLKILHDGASKENKARR